MDVKQLFARKSIDGANLETELKRTLGPVALTMLGIGAIIGTGIFVLTGTAAFGGADHMGAGPAIIISFMVTGFACALAALCYGEFAAMVPVSGSAYTYAYSAFGELLAWIIGWDLILEYAVGNIAVAIGWSGYFHNLLVYFGIHLPPWLLIDPVSVSAAINAADPSRIAPQTLAMAQAAMATAPNIGFPIIFNAPAMLVVLAVTALLVIGVSESAKVNAALVILKIVLISLFLWVGVKHVDTATHWQSFAPNGWKGIMTGSALIFFAYIGFDAVSTTAEEAKNPQRDLPIGMIASLVICTILYIAVAAVLTGMVPLNVLGNAKPVAAALDFVGEHTVSTIISLGAVLSITSVLVVLQLAQTRIFYSMSRDGLIPPAFGRVHPKFRTPVFATIITGIFVAIPAGFIDINVAAELTNIGTLFAFVLVAGGIIILRRTEPTRYRAFRVPMYYLVCPGCILMCVYLMGSLTATTWWRFLFWMAVGVAVYFVYGYRHSKLRTRS